MPLNVRRLVFSTFCVVVLSVGANAQTSTNNDSKSRLNRAKALIAARNFSAATAELEAIRRSANDTSAQEIASVMLVSIYLEQTKYTNVSDILTASFERYKTSRDGAYFGIAGKIIGGAKAQVERYRQLGLKVNDDKLPAEVAQDLDVWRSMLETLIRQSEEMTMKSQKTTEPYMLMEEAVGARSLMARDVYDAARWKTAMDDVREMVAESQTKVEEVGDDSQIFSANVTSGVASTAPNASVLSANAPAPKSVIPASAPPASTESVFGNRKILVVGRTPNPPQPSQKADEVKTVLTANVESPTVAPTEVSTSKVAPVKTESALNVAESSSVSETSPSPTRRERVASRIAANPTTEETSVEAKPEVKPSLSDTIVSVGSLIEYADLKVPPVYPQVAKTARVTGIVRVELKVDEKGEVTDAQVVSGPEMLKRAAVDAARRWRFKPVMREGQATRAAGFISFNFTL